MELQLADAELLLKLSEHLGGQDSAQDACWPRLSILPQFRWQTEVFLCELLHGGLEG